MTSADDVQTAIWSLSWTWMSVWRSILNDLGPVSFCGPYWITSSIPVCKLMCFFPPIHNPPHAAISSAPDLAEPALTPGDVYSSWERAWQLQSAHVWFEGSLRFVVETSAPISDGMYTEYQVYSEVLGSQPDCLHCVPGSRFSAPKLLHSSRSSVGLML